MNIVLFTVYVIVFSVSAKEPPPPKHVGRHPKVLESRMGIKLLFVFEGIHFV